jgi:hypothetical protein
MTISFVSYLTARAYNARMLRGWIALTALLGLLAACSPPAAAATQTPAPTAETSSPFPTPPATVLPQTEPAGTYIEAYLSASPGFMFRVSELEAIAAGETGTGGISAADASVFLENADTYIHNVNARRPNGAPS